MNEQEHTTDPAVLKEQLNKQSNVDSNGSSGSSIKILINDEEDENRLNNYHSDSNDEDESNEKTDKLLNETNNQSEQRTSVIVQASNIKSDNDETTKNEKPKFLFESKLSSTMVNDLFNTAQSSLKLRPSVLRINDNVSSSSDSTQQQQSTSDNDESPVKETKNDNLIEPNIKTKSTNPFKFAPLTDKKPNFGFVSSITSSSNSAVLATTSSLTSSLTSGSSKSSFQTNNGDKQSANYFTENLFQSVTQSTSNNSPESSTFSLASSNAESTGGFVFGQNLQERVTNIVEKSKIAASSTSADQPTTTSEQSNAFSLIFPNDSNVEAGSTATVVSEKRKFENITGEEEETNVVHIYCKLFQWDSVQSAWKERGKGNLRLNDKFDEERTTSRLIMRTAGSLKLILNCLIISGMKVELTNDSKCLRFSNVDGIYLIKGKQMDIEHIYSLIEQRLRLLPKKSRAEESKQSEEDDYLKNGSEIKEKLILSNKEDEESDHNTSNTSDRLQEEDSYRSEETSINKDDEKDDKENSNDENNENSNEDNENSNDEDKNNEKLVDKNEIN